MTGGSDDQISAGLVRDFRDLKVYKRAFDKSIEVHKTSLNFPKIEQYALADQIRRCTKSICANIAEGFVKQQASKAEFRRFLLIAMGSAQETLVWIEYCRTLNYIETHIAEEWHKDYQEIIRMLQAFYSKS